MKRSQVNEAIAHAMKVLNKNSVQLPAFAHWTPEEWRENAGRLENLRKIMLGWDVTDFGFGRFEQTGGVLFTLRNGHPTDPSAGTPYAEKLIILRPGQALPYHFHRVKTEDIINRGGGTLCIRLYNSRPDDTRDEATPVNVLMDGIRRTWAAGETVQIAPGNSITLPPGLYHRLWAHEEDGDLVAGEVSSINDDRTDNIFWEPSERYTGLEEDTPAHFVLCNEYDRFCT